MGDIINAIILGNVTKRLHLIEEYITKLNPKMLQMIDAVNEDDKRMIDLQDKVNVLEKKVRELEQQQQQQQ